MTEEKEQTQYVVVWEIDLWGDSPEEVAREALKIHRDRYSIANIFKVINKKTGEEFKVDLQELMRTDDVEVEYYEEGDFIEIWAGVGNCMLWAVEGDEARQLISEGKINMDNLEETVLNYLKEIDVI